MWLLHDTGLLRESARRASAKMMYARLLKDATLRTDELIRTHGAIMDKYDA